MKIGLKETFVLANHSIKLWQV